MASYKGTYLLRQSQDNYQGSDVAFLNQLRDTYSLRQEQHAPNFAMLFILKKTRVASDILATWGSCQEELKVRPVVLVVFHHTAPHMPLPMATTDTLAIDVKEKFFMIVDVHFWQGKLNRASATESVKAIGKNFGIPNSSKVAHSSGGTKQDTKSSSGSWFPSFGRGNSKKPVGEMSSVDGPNMGRVQQHNAPLPPKSKEKPKQQLTQCHHQKDRQEEWTKLHPPVTYHMKKGTGEFNGCDIKLQRALEEKGLCREESIPNPHFVLLCCLKTTTVHDDVRRVWEEHGQMLKDKHVILAVFHPISKHLVNDFLEEEIRPKELASKFPIVVNILFFETELYPAPLEKALQNTWKQVQAWQSARSRQHANAKADPTNAMANPTNAKADPTNMIVDPTNTMADPHSDLDEKMDVSESVGTADGRFEIKIQVFQGKKLIDDDLISDILAPYVDEIKNKMEEIYLNKVTENDINSATTSCTN